MTNIEQITSVIRVPDGRTREVIIYGLGHDQKMYYWGRTKTTRRELAEPDEEGDTFHYEYEWGWLPYEP